jgi:thiol-disulfide isomerase/thioredoxin
MKNKSVFYAVAIISLIVLTSYLFTQKSVKEGAICPPTPTAKQNAQQPTTKAKTITKINVLNTAKSATGIRVTFIELGSKTCTPCIMMSKILDEIEKEYDGQVLVRFYDVNSILGRPYAQQYGVRAIPTQVFLDKDGKEYFRHIGFFPKEEVVKILQLRGVK